MDVVAVNNSISMIWPAAVRPDPETLVAFDLPDFREGAMYEQFIGALRASRETLKQKLRLSPALDRASRPDATEVDVLLDGAHGPGRAAVIRIDYDDTDLVLLHANRGDRLLGLLLEVKFSRADDSAPAFGENDHVRVIARLVNGSWLGAHYSQLRALKAPDYFARLLRTLHALQKCVAETFQRAIHRDGPPAGARVRLLAPDLGPHTRAPELARLARMAAADCVAKRGDRAVRKARRRKPKGGCRANFQTSFRHGRRPVRRCAACRTADRHE